MTLEAVETPAKARATKLAVPKIYAAIEAVQAGVGTIPKNGKMKFGNTEYEYVKNDDILEAVTVLLSTNHIVVRPELLAFETELREIGANRTIPIVKVLLKQTYISTQDGSEFEVQVFGEATGSDDKGLRKAVTSAQKIANLLTFSIATGEPDPDAFANPEPQAAAPASSGRTGSLPNDKVGNAGDPLIAARSQVKTLAGTKGWSNQKVNELGNTIHPDWFSDIDALRTLHGKIQEA